MDERRHHDGFHEADASEIFDGPLFEQVLKRVLEIILQHEHSSDTPESMSLLKNKEFVRDEVQNASIFRSNKSGMVYTFVDGKLRTTRFTFSEAQLAKMRR